jgi:transposase
MNPSPPVIGIDCGADVLHCALSSDKSAPVHQIDLSDPAWHKRLAALTSPGMIAALEPTGWHYAAPVIAALAVAGVRVLLVDHAVTGKQRALKVSSSKTDKTDAKTLAYIAAGHLLEPYKQVREINPTKITAAMALRMLIHSYMRADKERARAVNRMRQLAHGIAPVLDHSMGVYMRAIHIGAGHPSALRRLAETCRSIDADVQEKRASLNYPEGFERADWRAKLYTLVEELPDWADNPIAVEALFEEYRAYRLADERKEALKARLEYAARAPIWRHITDAWMTVPCASLVRCAVLHSATRGVADQMTPDQFKASVGTFPRVEQSGAFSQTTAGRSGLRAAKRELHMWVLQLIRLNNNPIAQTFQRHKQAGDKYALSKAKAKLANILSGIARNGQPYDPHYDA